MFSLIITALVVVVILVNLKNLCRDMVKLVSKKTEVLDKSRIARIHGFSIPCILRLAFSYGVLAAIASWAGAVVVLPTIAATVGVFTVASLLVSLYAKKAELPAYGVAVMADFKNMMDTFDQQMAEERRKEEAQFA